MITNKMKVVQLKMREARFWPKMKFEPILFQVLWQFFNPKGSLLRAGGRKIRYVKKSSISVNSFVLHHHPDDVNHLSTETDEGLFLGFSLVHLSFELYFRFFIPASGYLRQSHAMKSAV